MLVIILIFFFFFCLTSFYDRKNAFGTVEIHRLTSEDTRDCILDSLSELLYKALAGLLLPKIYSTLYSSLFPTLRVSLCMMLLLQDLHFMLRKVQKKADFPLCHGYSYIIHLYCLTLPVGLCSDVVDYWTLTQATPGSIPGGLFYLLHFSPAIFDAQRLNPWGGRNTGMFPVWCVYF